MVCLGPSNTSAMADPLSGWKLLAAWLVIIVGSYLLAGLVVWGLVEGIGALREWI
jgi:hypothetical protein